MDQGEASSGLGAKGLLVDLDGVLVDSIVAQTRCWAWWAEQHGLDAGPFVDSHGRTARDKIQELAPHLAVDFEAGVIAQREMSDTDGVVALAGAAELLAVDMPLAIVTSATVDLAVARLAAARLVRPENLITAESVSRGKPDPEAYLLGAAVLGLVPADCVVIEDAPAGVVAAKRAGMQVVAVTTTHAGEELVEADLVVSGLPEVIALLLS